MDTGFELTNALFQLIFLLNQHALVNMCHFDGANYERREIQPAMDKISHIRSK